MLQICGEDNKFNKTSWNSSIQFSKGYWHREGVFLLNYKCAMDRELIEQFELHATCILAMHSGKARHSTDSRQARKQAGSQTGRQAVKRDTEQGR